jgi:hypothetical protein
MTQIYYSLLEMLLMGYININIDGYAGTPKGVGCQLSKATMQLSPSFG